MAIVQISTYPPRQFPREDRAKRSKSNGRGLPTIFMRVKIAVKTRERSHGSMLTHFNLTRPTIYEPTFPPPFPLPFLFFFSPAASLSAERSAHNEA